MTWPHSSLEVRPFSPFSSYLWFQFISNPNKLKIESISKILFQVIVELILEVYCECARKMLCYLNTTASRQLYQQTINLIRMYAHHNQGKRSIEKEQEEEQFRDILLLMELLTSILSKDFIDLSPPDANAPEDGVLASGKFP